MILLLIPFLIAYFGGFYGKIYVMLGIVSLTLDWFIFYRPHFDKDFLSMKNIMANSGTLLNDDPHKFEQALNTCFEYMKHEILLATIQSLGWWVFTSWRWLAIIFNPSCRNLVGLAFINATFHDEVLRLKLEAELNIK